MECTEWIGVTFTTSVDWESDEVLSLIMETELDTAEGEDIMADQTKPRSDLDRNQDYDKDRDRKRDQRDDQGENQPRSDREEQRRDQHMPPMTGEQGLDSNKSSGQRPGGSGQPKSGGQVPRQTPGGNPERRGKDDEDCGCGS